MTFATPNSHPAAPERAHDEPVEVLVLLDMRCPYSQALADEIASVIAGEFPQLRIQAVSAATAIDLARRYRVTRLPGLIFRRDGRAIGNFAGVAPARSIAAWVAYTLQGGVAPPALQGPSSPYQSDDLRALRLSGNDLQ